MISPLPPIAILDSVAKVFNLSVEQIKGSIRYRQFTRARWAAVLLLDTLRPDLRMSDICQYLRKDHSSIRNARYSGLELRASKAEFAEQCAHALRLAQEWPAWKHVPMPLPVVKLPPVAKPAPAKPIPIKHRREEGGFESDRVEAQLLRKSEAKLLELLREHHREREVNL
jgi:hypothetical protein